MQVTPVMQVTPCYGIYKSLDTGCQPDA